MIEYNPENLSKLLFELEPKKRIQAVKGAFRKAANKVRKQAVANLRQSGINANRDLEKGIRRIVYKKKPGFRVTVGTKKANKQGNGEQGFHINRKGLKKPILIWAEEGTKERKTRSRSKFFVRKRKGHLTGRMKKYGFMEKTQRDMKDKVTEDLRLAMEESIIKTVKKYGK